MMEMDSAANNGYHCPNGETIQELKDLANRMRITAIQITNAANSGHPTSGCSAAEIMAALFFSEMRYDPKHPRDANADRFVLSKGHACPILYAAWVETGHLTHNDVMQLRNLKSDIEGHPTPRLDFIDVATGSLGQGLSCACGMAYVGKYIDKASYRVYCMLGDGESAEGSVWEAAAFAGIYKLDNLVAIIDVNRLGQSQATSLGHDVNTYAKRMEAFGFHSIIIDGHDIEAVLKAFHYAKTVKEQPIAIIAKTLKGKGIVNVEDKDGWHGKPVPADTIAPIASLIHNKGVTKLKPNAPIADAPVVDLNLGHIKLSSPPSYKLGEKVATRAAYGTALVKIGEGSDRIIALDGDTKNSTFSEKFLKRFPDRFIECFIAEQNMVGVAIGASTRNRTIPFCSTFGAFFTRAADQLRMGAVSFANIKCVGSHVGVSIGEDGPSQMALEDLALFRALPDSTVFYPTDAVACERAVELAANLKGIVYIRTGRPATCVIYKNDETFTVGQAKIVRTSATDQLMIVGAGVTLYEAMKAADQLKTDDGIDICIIDPFTIKPIDRATLIIEAKRVGGLVLTVEDHYAAGGIGETVASALADVSNVRVRSLTVHGVARSGTPDELIDMFGISAAKIVIAVKAFLAER